MAEDRRKTWCKVDVKDCSCLEPKCDGLAQKEFIEKFNTLSRYGLTTGEIFEDMAMKENSP